MARRRSPLSSLPNSARGRPRGRSMSPRDGEEAKGGSYYRERTAGSGRELMPTSGVAKAKKSKKSKMTPKSANLFEILADQDKENDPPCSTIQVQVERRSITDPRNAEVGIPTERPRKVNSNQGNSKDNTYALTDTPNTSSAVAATPIIDSISAPLTSAPSQGRAESLVSRPLSILPGGNNDQKDEVPSGATLGMLYRRLEHQDKHLEYQDGLLKEVREEIKDLRSIVSMLLIGIEGITARSQEPVHHIAGAITYAAVAAEAVTRSSSPPQGTQPIAATPRSSSTSGKSHFALDLSRCDGQVTSRGTAYIKKRLIEGLKSQEETKGSTFHMVVDPRKTHRYLLEFNSDNEALEARIHDAWVLRHGRIQAPESFAIKANSVQARAVLQPGTMAIDQENQKRISDKNAVAIVQMRWLSTRKPEALRGSLFIELANKQQAEDILRQGYMEIGGEDVHVEAFVPMEEVRKRCFKCQGFGHTVEHCKNELACSGCSMKGHAQKDCENPWIRCKGCNGSHRANDRSCPRYQLIPPVADSPSSPEVVDIPTRGTGQEEPTGSPNTSGRTNSLKESAGTPGNESVDLVVVPAVIVSNIPNTEGEGQEMEIDSPPTHQPITVEEI